MVGSVPVPSNHPEPLSYPLGRVEAVKVHDARRVRDAAEQLVAAVSALDLGAMLPEAHRELVALGERIERTGRTVKAMAAASCTTSAGPPAPTPTPTPTPPGPGSTPAGPTAPGPTLTAPDTSTSPAPPT